MNEEIFNSFVKQFETKLRTLQDRVDSLRDNAICTVEQLNEERTKDKQCIYNLEDKVNMIVNKVNYLESYIKFNLFC